MSGDSDKIQIEWNGRLQWVRIGTHVESLLTEKELKACQTGKAIVKDSHGNEVGLFGSLNQGDRLFIYYLPPSKRKRNT